MNFSISIRSLKKHYPKVKTYRELILTPFKTNYITALDGIDLDIEKGRCFFLLGPNGAGKTTLIKILSTLVLPNDGKAIVNGFDVEKDPERVKPLIGYAINEERSFYWRLSGRQNLEFYAALNNISPYQMDRKVNEVLELTNLAQVADNRYDTYSTGMKQMMSIARALLTDPEIIFVDEPTKSLDPQAARKIRDFLKIELAQNRNHTVFWTTHNLGEVNDYGDEIAIINKGKVRTKGNIMQLTNNRAISLETVYNKSMEK